jgi:4-hydroxy-tetrahydrodipicolinate synthase
MSPQKPNKVSPRLLTWQGIYPAVMNQINNDANESIDIAGTLRHLDWLIAEGMDGLIMLGSLGENATLTMDEKCAVLKASVKHVKGRVPVISGVAENSTRLACNFVARAEQLGVDGLMVLPAMIYNADSREALAHFRAVAKATSLPIMIYNNPPSYKVDVTPEMFKALADLPNIVAIKESSDNIRRVTDLHNTVPGRYKIFTGVDDLILEGLLLGVDGWVAGLVNAFPKQTRLLFDLAKAGQWDEARALYRWFTPLLHLDTHRKLVQYIKLCMAEVGRGTETTRAPRLKLEGDERKQVLKIIRDALKSNPMK